MFLKVLTIATVACSIIVSVGGVECHGKVVIDSKPLVTATGHTITMERFNCTEISGRPEAIDISKRDITRFTSKRSAAQCTTANCVCGIPCFFNSCSAVTQTIRPGDCTALQTSLMNNPATFEIAPNQGVGFILQSCEYTAFGNSVTTSTQYCFSDMGVAAASIFAACGSGQQGSCKGTLNGANFFVDQISL